MKQSLYLVLIALMPSLLTAAPTHLDIMVPDRMDTDLKGPVKSVELDVCENVSDEHSRERREYDIAGNLLKTSSWKSNGKLEDETTFFYDENGCYERQLYIDYENKRTNDWTVVLNPDTRQIALKNKRNGHIALETYSPAGYLISYKVLDEKRKQIIASNYERDENNRRLKYTRYSGNSPAYTFYFKWADNGLIDMERQQYLQEKAARLHTYEYLVTDEYGNWTQRIMARYDIGGGKREKVYEHTIIRKIEYFNNE